jgi:hypothetical protein
MADTIRDMLSVGQVASGDWAIYRWDTCIGGIVATFPREDEAFGVAVLACEYVEKHGHTPDRAIALALQGYREVAALDNEPEWSRLGYVG